MGIREVRRDRVRDWKAERGCRVCHIKDADMLEAHHLDSANKEFSLAHVSGKSIDSLDRELKKSECLCCNHHRKFTNWLRANQWTATKENFEVWLAEIGPRVVF